MDDEEKRDLQYAIMDLQDRVQVALGLLNTQTGLLHKAARLLHKKQSPASLQQAEAIEATLASYLHDEDTIMHLLATVYPDPNNAGWWMAVPHGLRQAMDATDEAEELAVGRGDTWAQALRDLVSRIEDIRGKA